MTEARRAADLARAERAIAQIRDALVTLAYASDGHFEDVAQVALDALDYLETWFTQGHRP